MHPSLVHKFLHVCIAHMSSSSQLAEINQFWMHSPCGKESSRGREEEEQEGGAEEGEVKGCGCEEVERGPDSNQPGA